MLFGGFRQYFGHWVYFGLSSNRSPRGSVDPYGDKLLLKFPKRCIILKLLQPYASKLVYIFK